MLKTSNLSFSYNTENQFVYPDIICGDGEHWLLMGESGCGKTTLLHLLAGLIKPQTGSILINGTETNKLKASEADRFRGKEIGIVFQKHHFVGALSVIENIKLSRFFAHEKVHGEEIETILGQLNLRDKHKSKPAELSQGELQRMSIARAVINAPSLLLADEPTSSLDNANCTEAIQLLKQVATRNNSVLIVVSHDQRLLPFFENIVELSNAKQ
jgi:ABC-type lipoprotein export system ATPase subunit